MASGLLKVGVDLDTLFAARTSAKRADVGFKVAGVDVSNRYETIGAASPIAATGFKAAGVDLASLFRGMSAHNLTAVLATFGAGVSEIGYNSSVPMGALSPAVVGGYTINGFFDYIDSGAPSSNGFYIVSDTVGIPQSLFATVTVNGHTYASAAADAFTNSGNTFWWWVTAAGLVNGGSYPVTFA
jgi:hypothetical protein